MEACVWKCQRHMVEGWIQRVRLKIVHKDYLSFPQHRKWLFNFCRHLQLCVIYACRAGNCSLYKGPTSVHGTYWCLLNYGYNHHHHHHQHYPHHHHHHYHHHHHHHHYPHHHHHHQYHHHHHHQHLYHHYHHCHHRQHHHHHCHQHYHHHHHQYHHHHHPKVISEDLVSVKTDQ